MCCSVTTCHGHCLTARVVLVDFRPPMDGGTCLSMLQALTDTLMLVHHLTGPSRVPLFSLIALGLYPEVILSVLVSIIAHVTTCCRLCIHCNQ